MNRRRRIAVALTWIGVVVVWFGYQRSTDVGAVDAAQGLVDTVRGAWWSLPVFVGLYTIRPLVLFPATLMSLAGGMLFGPIVGIVAVIIGSNASAVVAYGMARMVAGDNRLAHPSGAGDGFVGRWADRLRERGFVTVLTMRLLLLPYDLVHYSAGVVRVPLRSFMAATALGSLPATLSVVTAGASVERIADGPSGLDWRMVGAAAVLLLGSLTLTVWIRRRETASPGPLRS